MEKYTSKNENDLKKTGAKAGLIKRSFAVLGLIFIALCLIGLIISIISGSEPGVTLMFLFGLIVIPCIFYAFAMTVRLFSKRNNSDASDRS